MPDWVFPTGLVVFCLAIWFAIAWRNSARQISATLDRRPNPTWEQFRQMLAGEVSPEASAFIWKTALVYLQPRLTPHPDDSLVCDLPIDDDEWSMDWPRDFAREQGFDERLFPDWPEGWPVTLRNYGKWLDLGSASHRGHPPVS